MIATRRLRRQANLAGFLIVCGLLGYAYFAQYVQGYQPCPLCWLQRYALLPVAGVFLLAGLQAPLGWGAKIYALLGVLTSAVGAGVAGYHVYIQYTPDPPACGAPFEVLWSGRQNFFGFLQRVFETAGDCADIDWSFLGLSMPAWVLIWFIALGALAVVANAREI